MNLVLFYFLALFAEVVGTVGGFGSSVFLIPIAGLFFDFETVLAITGVLHVFSNIIKVIIFNKGVNLKLVLTIGIPSIVFVFIGSILTNYINLVYAEIILGIFLVMFSATFFVKPNLSLKPSIFNSISGGSVAGFLAGLIGTGGAVRGLSLAAFNLEKAAFISTSAVIDLGVDTTRSAVYLYNGFLERELYFTVPILLVIALFGNFIGKWILNKIPQEKFKKIVLIFIFGIGAFMVVKYFKLLN